MCGSLLSLLVMKLRLARCEPVIVKLLQIQKYEEILKEKKARIALTITQVKMVLFW